MALGNQGTPKSQNCPRIQKINANIVNSKLLTELLGILPKYAP